LFAAAVCGVCSVFVAGAAVLLKDAQEANAILDRQQKVLGVAGLVDRDEELTAEETASRFDKSIKAVVVDLETGKATDIDPKTFDQQAEKSDPANSHEAPPNDAKVLRLPNHGLVYQVVDGGEVSEVIIPIEGKGLWSTLYGYLALDKDANTIKGITFYKHGETPGLGGEIENPRWQALWPGRKAYDDNGKPKISVKKGQAGSPEEDPYNVDGLSGATLTSRGVTHLLHFWLGENGFGPYLEHFRSGQDK
jgi:Na+-transporting NADH:ubiquinone oxidoreductase subunit C